MSQDESTSSVFVDPSGRRRRILTVLLAGLAALAVGYLVLVGLSVFGAPLPPGAKLPLPAGIEPNAERETSTTVSPGQSPSGQQPTGESSPATGTATATVAGVTPGSPGTTGTGGAPAPGAPGTVAPTTGPAAPPPATVPPPAPTTAPPAATTAPATTAPATTAAVTTAAPGDTSQPPPPTPGDTGQLSPPATAPGTG